MDGRMVRARWSRRRARPLLLAWGLALLAATCGSTQLIANAPRVTARVAPGPLSAVAVATTSTTVPQWPRPTPGWPLGPVPAALGAYRGLGAWVDIYDWSAAFTNGSPRLGPASVDAISADGAQTLFIQVAATRVGGLVLEPDRLAPILARAHQRGLHVVAWFLPTFVDLNADLAHLTAIAQLPVDSIAVDIESLAVRDPVLRSQRLIALSDALRSALPGRALGAIVPSPTLTDVVDRGLWPGFPWSALASVYDVWLPMAYWSLRSPASGWQDPFRYTTDSVVRLRHDLARPDARVDPIGGLAIGAQPADAQAFVEAVRASGSIGGGLYNSSTTASSVWAALHPLHS